MTDTLPKVHAHRILIRGSWHRVVLDCPFCHHSHVHADSLGIRLAHCGEGRGFEYTIVDPNGSVYLTGARRYLGDRCERCSTPEQLEAHHCDEDRTNNSPANIQTLCKPCHLRWHATARRAGITPSGRAPSATQASVACPPGALGPLKPTDRAALFLREMLAQGPASFRDVSREGLRRGLRERTLERAAKRMGIKHVRAGSGKSHRSLWTLPAPGDWDTVTE